MQDVDSAIADLGNEPPLSVDGSEDRDIVIPMRNRDPLSFKGEFFLKHWAMPNFMFHTTMTYALLRHNGVDIGKRDFLNM